MKPKVSIIIPAYNAENTISRALESALKQTYSNKEVIIVDDGSKDRTLAICKEYQLNNHEISIFSQKNSGVSVARNLGIRRADGEFIQFLDADDAMEPNMTEKLIETQRNDDSDYVICGLTIIKGNDILRTPHLKTKNISFIDFEDYKYIYPLLAAPCNKLFKKELIVPFEKKFSNGEDLLFNTEYLTKIKSISIIEDSLYNVYLDNESSLNKNMSVSSVKSLLLVNKYEKEIMNRLFDNDKVLKFNVYNKFKIIQTTLQKIVLHEEKDDVIELINSLRSDSQFITTLEKINVKSMKSNLIKFCFNHCDSNTIYKLFFLISKVRGYFQ